MIILSRITPRIGSNDPLGDHPRLNTVIAWQKYAKIQTNPDREGGGEINVMKLKRRC